MIYTMVWCEFKLLIYLDILLVKVGCFLFLCS